MSEPYPKSAISPQDTDALLFQTDIERWTIILCLLSRLLEHASSRSEIIPVIDHGRILYFFRFWHRHSSSLEEHTDFRDAVINFKDAFYKQ